MSLVAVLLCSALSTFRLTYADCVMGEWSAWTCDANTKCVPNQATSVGTRTRTRNIISQPMNNGQVCGATTEKQV